MQQEFVIDGQKQRLPSTPITISGTTHFVPVMNLETYLFCLEHVAPMINDETRQTDLYRRYVDSIALRMSSVDSQTTPLTPEYLFKNISGKEEIAGFLTQVREWLFLSGFLQKAGAPGE